jgi:hypothetical protein
VSYGQEVLLRMTARRLCPPAPGLLEDYAVHFDPLFHSLAQRHYKCRVNNVPESALGTAENGALKVYQS